MSSLRSIFVFALLSALGSSQTVPNKCPPVSAHANQRIENYLGQRLVAGTDVKPAVKSIDPMADTCYRKVTMTIPGTVGDVVMYLSADERFLTSTLYDLSVDPQKEVTRIANNVSTLLMRDRSPELAGPKARIILVEFVDFQCPFCKRFAEWYQNLPASLRDQSTLVFKQLPLPQHRWAHMAASYAICANFQSDTAFHKLTDTFFVRQPDITPETVRDVALAALRQSAPIDFDKLAACVFGEESSQSIERDIALAKQLNVNSTPTLFMNGRRVLRVASAQELRQLLETELANVNSNGAQTESFQHSSLGR